jgi:hypothetical protein
MENVFWQMSRPIPARFEEELWGFPFGRKIVKTAPWIGATWLSLALTTGLGAGETPGKPGTNGKEALESASPRAAQKPASMGAGNFLAPHPGNPCYTSWCGKPAMDSAIAASSIRRPESSTPAPPDRNPVFDGLADPVLIWNPQSQAWWMVGTQSRTALNLRRQAWLLGREIGGLAAHCGKLACGLGKPLRSQLVWPGSSETKRKGTEQ